MAYIRKWLIFLPLVLVIVLPVLIAHFAAETKVSAQTADAPGSLIWVDAEGRAKLPCPLKQTNVKAEITGFISRVQVTQHFENPFNEKIEAVYTFPLPQNAAVDDMTMNVGGRMVRGKILPREEAQGLYEAAKSRGQVAGLLDQERPNIFTQSVANILPGSQVTITISYVEQLRYDDGSYEFVFPMVVGPRYIPGGVPDASRILPRLAGPEERNGHDISFEVSLDAGVIVENLETRTHPVDIERPSPSSARVKLRGGPTIPNKDFILRYHVAGKTIHDAVLTHRSERGGFFTLVLQPPDRVGTDDVTPKELVFVLDTSGSMAGFPIEKAKETMKLALDNLYPDDTFNLITFSGDTRILFEQPVRATKRNLRQAQDFLAATAGGGGTEMMGAIKAALEPSDSQSHMRIVCFMTDGHVGNDMAIIAEVQKHKNARVFAFGIGSSVNRFLLDNMAIAGRGEVEYVGLSDDGSAAAQRFHQRIRNPLLTDVSIDWNDLPISDVYPKRIPDVFGAKPVVVTGRYTAPGSGTIKLKGKMAGSEFIREIPVTLPETMALHDVLAPLWARARIDELMSEDYMGAQLGRMRHDLKQTITQLAMEFRLMTQFTSFVAVEEITVTDGGMPRRIDVPVAVPEGMNRNFLGGGYQANAGFIGPTGLFTAYSGAAVQTAQAYPYSVAPSPPAAPVTKSGGNVKASAGGGGAGGAGGNNGSNSLYLRPSGSLGQPPRSPEEEKSFRLAAKLQPTLLAVVYRVQQKQDPHAFPFVRNGRVEVQLWLTDKNEFIKAKLQELGFEIVLDHNGSNLMIGRVPADKLLSLIELDFVRYVSLQTSR
jgi:Ca-activated chloride channel family protein